MSCSQGSGNICEPSGSWSAAQAHLHHSWSLLPASINLGPSGCWNHVGGSLQLAELSTEQNFIFAAPGEWKPKQDFLRSTFDQPYNKNIPVQKGKPNSLSPTGSTSTFPTLQYSVVADTKTVKSPIEKLVQDFSLPRVPQSPKASEQPSPSNSSTNSKAYVWAATHIKCTEHFLDSLAHVAHSQDDQKKVRPSCNFFQHLKKLTDAWGRHSAF